MNELKIEAARKFTDALHKLTSIRNALAHSDSIIGDFGFVKNPQTLKLQIHFAEPETSSIDPNGRIKKVKYVKHFEDFDNNYEIIKDVLLEIDRKIIRKQKK